jgi:fructose-1,6-bisphosphatase I/sedoheptulose-1,7-bisphosphatase/fructose-1,6-bisphosphatase I
MRLDHTTLPKFLTQELQGSADARNLAALLIDVASAVKAISVLTAKGGLAGILGSLETENIQGEVQKKLDILSNTEFVNTFSLGGLVAGIAIEGNKRGPFLTLFDPLDGSSNIDVNVSVGSIFSVLRAPKDRAVVMADYLRPGREQIAAGYALYGPSTMFVLTVGKGTHGFTLDREAGDFILTHANIQVPADSSEFAINASNERFWEPPVLRYVSECKAGKTDVRGRDFNMRWIASMVADIHRILMRGGIFMYPKDNKDPSRPGRLRLMYEANPMGLVVEQAGGIASTGRGRILELAPELIHQRIPVIMGSRNEVERIERYHQEFDAGKDKSYSSPLFKERSLFQ